MQNLYNEVLLGWGKFDQIYKTYESKYSCVVGNLIKRSLYYSRAGTANPS